MHCRWRGRLNPSESHRWPKAQSTRRKEIASVKLLGSDEQIKWQRDGEALTIEAPQNKVCDHACAFAISFA
jgi:hypothetical protein